MRGLKKNPSKKQTWNLLLDGCTSASPGSAHNLLLWSVNESIIRFHTCEMQKKAFSGEPGSWNGHKQGDLHIWESCKAPICRTEGGLKLQMKCAYATWCAWVIVCWTYIFFITLVCLMLAVHWTLVSWYGTDLKWQCFVLINGCAPGNVKHWEQLQQ